MAIQKLSFQGWLFDGHSAVKHQVKIDLAPSGITLRVDDGATLVWNFDRIRWNSASDRKTPPYHIDYPADEHRVESLIVEDPDFIDNVRRMAPHALDSVMDRNPLMKWGFIFLGLVILPFFIYGLWTFAIPALSDKVAMQVPTSWEDKLGQKVFDVFFSDDLTELNAGQVQAIDKIEERLLLDFPDQPYNIRIHVGNRDLVNALALPGGHIVIFQGLLNQTDRPEELAGVLAHEIQHVLKRHSTKSVLRALASKMLLTLMVGDVNGVMDGTIGIAEELNGLKISRGMETEADREGMKMVIGAGIDPIGMVTMFQKLAQEEKKIHEQVDKALGREPKAQGEKRKDENSWLDYFSTHPQGEDRIQLLQAMADKQTGKSFTPLLPQVDWKKLMHRVKEAEEE
jgi:Zn-dependent protease with chaperone function